MLRAIADLQKSINSIMSLQIRAFSVQNVSTASKTKEICISVPCGTIAAKWWGPQDVRPIVAVHGWQDNSGTFDRLIPLLPNHISYLAIDLPGHGQSSLCPAGLIYYTVDNVHLLESIRQQYNWDQISLMGHSRGAVINYAYSTIFPDKVNLVVAIDPFEPYISYPAEGTMRTARIISKCLESNAYSTHGTKPPKYTYEESIDHLYNETSKSVSKTAVSYLHKRLNRLNHLFPVCLGWSPEENLDLAKRLTMPHLCFKMNRSDSWVHGREDRYRICFDLIRKGNPNFEGLFLNEPHHVHLSKPEKVAPVIERFLKKYWKKLPTSEIVGEGSQGNSNNSYVYMKNKDD